MKLIPLTLKCPNCGSGNVAYSCEPDCCFNHVCEDCLGNFQLATRDLDRAFTGLVALTGDTSDVAQAASLRRFRPDTLDSCAPTVKCAKCQSLDVCSIEEDDLAACLACGATLALVYQ